MQNKQFTTYLRTVGLLIGATLFIVMIIRSSQGASSEVAVKGKPSLWLSTHVMYGTARYNVSDLAAASPAPIAAPPASISEVTAKTAAVNQPNPPVESAQPEEPRSTPEAVTPLASTVVPAAKVHASTAADLPQTLLDHLR